MKDRSREDRASAVPGPDGEAPLGQRDLQKFGRMVAVYRFIFMSRRSSTADLRYRSSFHSAAVLGAHVALNKKLTLVSALPPVRG
jgi:hypothetical protein